MLEETQLESLKERHGEIFLVEILEGETLAFRRPSRAEYKRFKAQALDDHKRIEADEQLVRSVVVYPEGAELEALLDRKPALATSLAGEVLEVAGAVQGLQVKKA